jgi:Ca2+-binding EF-hand superfamily protein
MTKLGRVITDEEIDEIMKRHDDSGDKVLQLEEFKKMILGNE